MISYRPTRIYVDPKVQESPITQRVLKSFPNVQTELSCEQPTIHEEIRHYPDPLTEGKQRLWITKNRGGLVRKCGASTSSLNQLVCCNYYILDFSFNCHFECVYCFLQEYTNLPLMVIYANIDEMLESVQEFLDTTSSSN